MKKLNVYSVGLKKLLWSGNAKEVYSNIYFRSMPVLGEKRCKEILSIVSPDFKLTSAILVFEWVDSGYTGVQCLHKAGTILNF